MFSLFAGVKIKIVQCLKITTFLINAKLIIQTIVAIDLLSVLLLYAFCFFSIDRCHKKINLIVKFKLRHNWLNFTLKNWSLSWYVFIGSYSD